MKMKQMELEMIQNRETQKEIIKDSKETIQSNINLLLEQDIKLFNKWIMLKCYIIVLYYENYLVC